MWFFLSVIFLWGATEVLARPIAVILPPVVIWGAWTSTLWLCGYTAFQSNPSTLLARLGAIIGYPLVVIYYATQAGTYLTFLPSDSANPDLWPTLYLLVNLLIPLALVLIGCLSAGYTRRGEG